MVDFLEHLNTLSVSVGGGYLSAFEVGALKPGDVIRTTRQAGYSATLILNGTALAACEVVLLGGAARTVFGARVTSADAPPPRDAGPAARDDLVELLPFEVVIGSIQVSLASLRGVGRNTLINLDRPFSTQEDASLVVTGLPVAVGKVIVLGEEFGIRLTRVLGEPFREDTIRASGCLLDPDVARRVKDYDFRRPDRFSRNAIVNITETHRYFLRNLSGRFPAAGGLTLPAAEAGVDQCTFAEAQEWLKAGGELGLLVAENLPRRPQPATEADRWGAPGKLILEPDHPATSVAAEVRAWFDQAASLPVPARDFVLLYYRAGGPVQKVLSSEPEALLACLRGGWKHLVDFNLRVVPESDPVLKASPLVRENEMVILVRAADPDSRTALAIVYPYPTLEPIIEILD